MGRHSTKWPRERGPIGPSLNQGSLVKVAEACLLSGRRQGYPELAGIRFTHSWAAQAPHRVGTSFGGGFRPGEANSRANGGDAERESFNHSYILGSAFPFPTQAACRAGESTKADEAWSYPAAAWRLPIEHGWL